MAILTSDDVNGLGQANVTIVSGSAGTKRLAIESSDGSLPTFQAIYDRIGLDTDKHVATLFNTSSSTKIVLQRIWVWNWQFENVRARDNEYELLKITARTSGSNVTIRPEDSADSVPSGVTADTDSTSVTQSFLLSRIMHSSEEVTFKTPHWLPALSTDHFAKRYERKPGTRGWTLRQNEGLSLKFAGGNKQGTVSVVYEFTTEDA